MKRIKDPQGNTVIHWIELSHLYKKHNAKYLDRVDAVLKVGDETAPEPYMVAKFYDMKTGEYADSFYCASIDEAMDLMLLLQDECLCPLKVAAQSHNCACDYSKCEWYLDGDNAKGHSGCTLKVRTQLLSETCDAINRISEKIASIDATMLVDSISN